MARFTRLTGVASVAAVTLTLGALVASAQPRDGREAPPRRGPPDMERLLGGEGGRELLRENLVRRLDELADQRKKIQRAIEAIDAGEEPVGVARKLMGETRERFAGRYAQRRAAPSRDARDDSNPELGSAPAPADPPESAQSLPPGGGNATEESSLTGQIDAASARVAQMTEVRQRAHRLDEAIRIQSAVLRRIEQNPQASQQVIDRRRTELRSLLEQRFEIEAGIAEARIASMESRLDALKQGLARRQAEREQFIDNRLEGLLRYEPPVDPND
ncbi:MAG: hypothetical protein AAGG07_03730 [Planctomycetota bacterium]